MGREVRRVPADWQHPKVTKPNFLKGVMEERYQPMFDKPFAPAMREWYADWDAWERGTHPDRAEFTGTFVEWSGPPPDPDYYRPDWPDESRTHLMMYEDTSEGTPISPAFKTPEELARWLADNNASAFGSETASYEGWLRVARGGFACSAVGIPGVGIVNGVDALTTPTETAHPSADERQQEGGE
jgi:hypothetical protein